jgi:hypothetical protein
MRDRLAQTLRHAGSLPAYVILAGLVVVLGSGCTAAMLFNQQRPDFVDDYPSIHVRVYRINHHLCRVELVTATATIVTGVARCTTIAHHPPP